MTVGTTTTTSWGEVSEDISKAYARFAGEVMARYLDWQLRYLDLALTPAAMRGGPVILGCEE